MVSYMNKLGTLLVLPDTHCGSDLGLTPPQFDSRPEDMSSAAYATYAQRRSFWSWFDAEVDAVGRVDGVLALGDLTEGTGRINAGRDCLTTDRIEQARMATAILKKFPGAEMLMVRGTPYHVGDSENFEDVVADFVSAKIEDSVYANVYGTTVYARHKIGKSGSPVGWATAPAREMTWNVINASTQNHPEADLLLYAHIHEHALVSKWGKTAITCPALQLPGTEYGKRNMSGNYDVGFLTIDFYEGGKFDPVAHIYPAQAYAPQVLDFLA